MTNSTTPAAVNEGTRTHPETVADKGPGSVPVKEPDAPLRARTRDFSFWYGTFQALQDINLPIVDHKVTALIGASGCGKSTFLRSFNRMHDLYPDNRYRGEIRLYPEDINIVGPEADPMVIRLRVGMVFQRANPFPKSVFENVAAGLRVRGVRNRTEISDRVEWALKQAALWDEVNDRLASSAYSLSGGQQQRLCIARALAPKPELLLLDEPTSALDPIATAKIEDLITDLSANTTVLIVTHNMQQAARISDYTAFMHLGRLVEYNDTNTLFTTPDSPRTEAYITGKFG